MCDWLDNKSSGLWHDKSWLTEPTNQLNIGMTNPCTGSQQINRDSEMANSVSSVADKQPTITQHNSRFTTQNLVWLNKPMYFYSRTCFESNIATVSCSNDSLVSKMEPHSTTGYNNYNTQCDTLKCNTSVLNTVYNTSMKLRFSEISVLQIQAVYYTDHYKSLLL